jgi:hypothetical protein
MQIIDYCDESGQFERRKIAAILRTSVDAIATTVGLTEDAFQIPTRVKSDETQRRLRESTLQRERLLSTYP